MVGRTGWRRPLAPGHRGGQIRRTLTVTATTCGRLTGQTRSRVNHLCLRTGVLRRGQPFRVSHSVPRPHGRTWCVCASVSLEPCSVWHMHGGYVHVYHVCHSQWSVHVYVLEYHGTATSRYVRSAGSSCFFVFYYYIVHVYQWYQWYQHDVQSAYITRG
jgi:hypothetical protein